LWCSAPLSNAVQDHPFTLTIGPQAILQEVCGGPGQGYAFGVQAMDSTPIILGDVLVRRLRLFSAVMTNRAAHRFKTTTSCSTSTSRSLAFAICRAAPPLRELQESAL
jgi:hypothetical protein